MNQAKQALLKARFKAKEETYKHKQKLIGTMSFFRQENMI
jgi:hypothetical protein